MIAAPLVGLKASRIEAYMMIRVYSDESPEYNRMTMAAEMLTRENNKGYEYLVETVLFDNNHNWKYTTIVCFDGKSKWPVLSLERQMNVLSTRNMEFTVSCILKDIEEVNKNAD